MDTITRAYKFRLFVNERQEVLLKEAFGCSRYVYNYFRDYAKKQYEEKNEKTNYSTWSGKLTKLKATTHPWLADPSSIILQQSLRHLETAYGNFFRGIKTGKRFGYPNTKNKHGRQSITFVGQASLKHIHFEGNSVKLPKMGTFNLRNKGNRVPPEGHRLQNITVSRNTDGKYYISVTVIEPKLKIRKEDLPKSVVGIDVGIKDLIITSKGEKYINHKLTKCYEDKLAKAQRSLSRKKKGSSNRAKAKLKVAKIHAKIRNTRNDYIHKLTTQIVLENQAIGYESLRVANMIKNRKLSKALADASLGEVLRQFEYKTYWYGRVGVPLPLFFPSSQLCNCCKTRFEGQWNLSIRKWTCPNCKTELDRDINAALNVENYLLQELAKL